MLDRSGYVVGAVWTRAYLGRILLMLGRRREALHVLDDTLELCRVRRNLGLQRIVELTLEEDPLAPGWLDRETTVSPAQVGEFVRNQVRGVLRAACAELALPPHRIGVATPASADYAFDRALLELAHALIAARAARERLAVQHVQRAVDQAAVCHADPDVIPAMYGRLRDRFRARAAEDPRGDRTGSAPPLVIDGVHHEVRDGELRVVMASRTVLRRLLYAFIRAADHYLDHDAITRALWSCDYDPLRHGSSVHSNIRRLRGLFAGTRLAIQTDGSGYRLSLPPCAVVVWPPDAP
jgi:hypothetical protein